jgi:hypothetical protein
VAWRGTGTGMGALIKGLYSFERMSDSASAMKSEQWKEGTEI